MMRKPMIDAALNRNCSRPDAESSSASTVPATTTTAPRRASFIRHRFLTRLMTSTSSRRWSMSGISLKGQINIRRGGRDPKRAAIRTFNSRARDTVAVASTGPFALQELLFPRQLIRDNRLDRQQQEAGHHQVPPQALAPLGLLARHFLRRDSLLRSLGGATGHCRDQLRRIHRRELRFRRVQIDGQRLGPRTRRRARLADLINPLLAQFEQPFVAFARPWLRDAFA